MRARAFTALVLLLLGGAALWTQQPEGVPVRPRALLPTTPENLRRALETTIEIPEEFKQQVPLRLVLKHFGTALTSEGLAFPIWIDQNAFKRETPDAGDYLDTNITFPAFIKEMRVRKALEIALSQIPTSAGVRYLVRENTIEITTREAAKTKSLLMAGIVVDFRNVPLHKALDELSDRTGVSIGFDPQANELLKTPVDLRSNGDMSTRGVLQCLADNYGLRLVVDEDRVFLSSRERYMERLQAELAEAKVRKEIADASQSPAKDAKPARKN